MERYYDGDQEALFKAAHVINPYVKPKKELKVMTEKLFIYVLAPIVPTTFTHIWIRTSSASCVRLCGERVLSTRSLTSRSLPGKSFSHVENSLKTH